MARAGTSAASMHIQLKIVYEESDADPLLNRSAAAAPMSHTKPNPKIRHAPNTIQFNLQAMETAQVDSFQEYLGDFGIHVKMFGAEGNPRFFKSWKYIDGIENVHLPRTESLLPYACDLPLPLYLTPDDIRLVGDKILEALDRVMG